MTVDARITIKSVDFPCLYPLPDLSGNGLQLAIYGTGVIAEHYVRQVRRRFGEDATRFFVNSSPASARYAGRPVFTPESPEVRRFNGYFLLASIESAQVMHNRLASLGIPEERLVHPLPPICNPRIDDNIAGILEIFVAPAVACPAELEGLLERLRWYLPRHDPPTVAIQVAPGFVPASPPPAGYRWIDALPDRPPGPAARSLLLVRTAELLDQAYLEPWRSRLYCMDPTFCSTVESQTLAGLAMACLTLPGREELREQSRRNFTRLLSEVAGARAVYVLGTGPSVESLARRSHRDHPAVVCNSLIRNGQLMEQLDTRVIVFGDPVFHLGWNDYATRFREDMLAAVEKHDCFVVTPEHAGPLLVAHYPQLANRLIAMPSGDELNIPAPERFFVKPSDNILTYLMLPLAAALTQRVIVAGCDGKKPKDTGFWRHGANVQYGGYYDAVVATHPSFFRDRDYGQYYAEHCRCVEEWLNYGRAQGRCFICATASVIPALAKLPGGQVDGG